MYYASISMLLIFYLSLNPSPRREGLNILLILIPSSLPVEGGREMRN
jgi:hypothetical protein